MSGPRVRFAPSPTGDLHIGNVRSGLFNYLFARATQGVFILRVEDTDRARNTPEARQAILDAMEWLGMDADEGPFFQSERSDLYAERLRQLEASGGAYRCYCTPAELDEMRTASKREGRATVYDRRCRDRTEPPAADAPYVLRAKIPQDTASGTGNTGAGNTGIGETVVDDLVRGRVVVRNDRIEDFVLARTDGSPVYNLTVVCDDVDMGITHVIRGDDHLSNTFKQANLYDLMGESRPLFAHLPMVLGPDGKKLGKRHGAASILAFREMGYLPETMLSFLARLGWSHGDQEVFTGDELRTLFDLGDCGSGAAIFDQKKLDWQNGLRIREMAPMELLRRATPFLEAAGLDPQADWLPRAVVAVQERAVTLVQVAEKLAPFYARGEIELDPKAAAKFLKPDARQRLRVLAERLAAVEPFQAPGLEQATRQFVEENELKMKHVGQPIRVAMTGGTVSPGIFDVMEIYGRDVSLARLRAAASGGEDSGGDAAAGGP